MFALCFDHRDRPSAAECMSHPWLWQQLCLSPDCVTTRTVRERSCGTKWAAPPEDPEDKENFLESPHTHAKRFRFDEETPAAGDGDFWESKCEAAAPCLSSEYSIILSLQKSSCLLTTTQTYLGCVYIPLICKIPRSTTQTKDNQLNFEIYHWSIAVKKKCENCTLRLNLCSVFKLKYLIMFHC